MGAREELVPGHGRVIQIISMRGGSHELPRIVFLFRTQPVMVGGKHRPPPNRHGRALLWPSGHHQFSVKVSLLGAPLFLLIANPPAQVLDSGSHL